jgi:Immunoglobulin I-set domain
VTSSGPTIIAKSDVSDIVANATDDVRIPCDVTTDPAERSNLIVEWRKDGKTLKPDGRKIFVDPVNYSLTLKNCTVNDTAGYTCYANDSLSAATSDISRLTVQGLVIELLTRPLDVS